MDLLKILKTHNIESQLAESIEEAIKSDIHKSFIPKTQYNKKVQELDVVKTELDDTKARLELPNEYETKYNDITKELEALKGEYETYKNDVTTKELRHNITSKISKDLRANGFTNDKVLKLMLKDLDYDKITLEEDKVVGFDLENFVKDYQEFKTESTIEGNPSPTPPSNNNTETDPWLRGYQV